MNMTSSTGLDEGCVSKLQEEVEGDMMYSSIPGQRSHHSVYRTDSESIGLHDSTPNTPQTSTEGC